MERSEKIRTRKWEGVRVDREYVAMVVKSFRLYDMCYSYGATGAIDEEGMPC